MTLILLILLLMFVNVSSCNEKLSIFAHATVRANHVRLKGNQVQVLNSPAAVSSID